tara:strand:+ start:87 stop:752 length:666 start_codon:yes stop_codon:yes gene_type:complete
MKSQFYGRRQSRKLSKEQQESFNKVMLDFGISSNSFEASKLFSESFFPLKLEIGSGSGEHIIKQAKTFPEQGFVACEPYLTGAAKLSRSIIKYNIKNIRLFVDDVRVLFDLLPAGAFDTIYILFPDPWPKKRHHKRRLINSDTLDQMSRLLKVDGSLWFATDHKGYLLWTIQRISNHKNFFYNLMPNRYFYSSPDGWEVTRYQAKANSNGLKSVFIEFKRV